MSKTKLKIAPPQTQFAIEKNVPIPDKIPSRGAYKNPYQDEFAAMELWDCLVIGKTDKVKTRVDYHAKRWGKKNNESFIFRNTEDGWRMWRIK